MGLVVSGIGTETAEDGQMRSGSFARQGHAVNLPGYEGQISPSWRLKARKMTDIGWERASAGAGNMELALVACNGGQQ